MTNHKMASSSTTSSTGKGFWKKNSSAIPGRSTVQRLSSSELSPSSGGGGHPVDVDQLQQQQPPKPPQSPPNSSSIVASNPSSNIKPDMPQHHRPGTGTGNSGHAGSNTGIGGGAATSFKDFEKSVSDAWDIQDLENTSVIRPAEMVEIATSHQPSKQLGGNVSIEPTKMSSSTAQPTIVTRTTTTAVESKNSTNNSSRIILSNNSKHAKIEALIQSESSIEIEDLRKLSWPGLSHKARAKAWKILCGYVPGNSTRQIEVLQRKQEEYQRYVDLYFPTKDSADHQDTYRQIHIDIPRMSPVVGLFQQRCVQEIFERILFIRAIRHPASSYVQGN